MLDTLALARRLHPGQRNSLDALAKRYSVDNSKRELHGALLDAQILADIYLAMTGRAGQPFARQRGSRTAARRRRGATRRPERARAHRRAPRAEEESAHEAMLAAMAKRGQPIWRELERDAAAQERLRSRGRMSRLSTGRRRAVAHLPL